jgi:hypothetical protein
MFAPQQGRMGVVIYKICDISDAYRGLLASLQSMPFVMTEGPAVSMMVSE